MKIKYTHKLVSLFTATLLAGALAPSAQAYTFDANVPSDIQKQMTQDIEFIGTIAGQNQSSLHQQIFGGVSGDQYDKFFKQRVTGIGLSSCGSSNAVACVQPFFDASKMWITQNYIKFSHPQIARMMVVFHEARHTESQNGNWSHATCPRPFVDANGKPIKSIWTGASLAGESACDRSPFGSYGSSLIMLKNISKFCTNCSEKVKMDAGFYADDQLKRVTNKQAYNQIIADLYSRSDEDDEDDYDSDDDDGFDLSFYQSI